MNAESPRRWARRSALAGFAVAICASGLASLAPSPSGRWQAVFVAGAAVLTLGLVAWAVVNLARMGPSASLEWWRQAWPHARTPAIFHRAISVALVIGTLLTLINQGDVILAGEIPSFGKMLLTYCVPYFVNTHGAVSARIKA